MKPGADSFERDPALERAWRAHSGEAPSPELDRAILAAAHRAVGSGPQDALNVAAEATRPQRWWMPLAAAATIGVIAIGILQSTPEDESLVAPDKHAAVVARRGAEDQAPVPAVGKTVDDTVKERDSGSVGARSDTADFRQKKKQETKPATPGPIPGPTSGPIPGPIPRPIPEPTPAPSSPPPSVPTERANSVAAAKPATRAAEPQPFPATTEPGKKAVADVKREAASGDAASNSAKAISQAPGTPAETPPAVAAEERVAPRKDVAGEPQQLAAAKDQAAAQSGRAPQAAEGAVSSFAAAPAPPAAPLRGRDSGLARSETMAQAAPAASPPPILAKNVAQEDELRAQARDPDAWIVRIRKLRDEGNTAEALRELREFRNRVPDADRRLPADLLAFANTFKP